MMKVEFTDYGIGIDHNMVITAREFLKAEEDKNEMELLIAAAECFSAPHCFDYLITTEEYKCVKSWLQKTSKVVFSIKRSCDYRRSWVEIGVIRDRTSCLRVRYSDDDGKTIYISENKGASNL